MTAQLISKVENIVVGNVKDTYISKEVRPAKSQIKLVDVGIDRAEIDIAMYGEYSPAIGDRVAVSTLGGWIYAEVFYKTVDAVADMIDKLQPIPDETQQRLVNMVLRHQMDAAQQARQQL